MQSQELKAPLLCMLLPPSRLSIPLCSRLSNPHFLFIHHHMRGVGVGVELQPSKAQQPIKLEHSVPTYSQMQFSASPSLMDGVSLTETLWFDLYDFSEQGWKTIQASAVFHVDKTRPTIIRLCPNLRTELALNECPGLDDILAQQPHMIKRRPGELVSPAKKIARTEAVSVTTQG
ncbi:hypothetical protein B0H17DRAFT_1213190 [Mycena rosella]|uniref:Uncharacterized protein n=1 Tax=Mycena rosella TaxID=1033263 RepID=A0AAD7G275_MYCRO|nr:hypothetical protein B0H17DRAFT_1213190 [Mycena rosella]